MWRCEGRGPRVVRDYRTNTTAQRGELLRERRRLPLVIGQPGVEDGRLREADIRRVAPEIPGPQRVAGVDGVGLGPVGRPARTWDSPAPARDSTGLLRPPTGAHPASGPRWPPRRAARAHGRPPSPARRPRHPPPRARSFDSGPAPPLRSPAGFPPAPSPRSAPARGVRSGSAPPRPPRAPAPPERPPRARPAPGPPPRSPTLRRRDGRAPAPAHGTPHTGRARTPPAPPPSARPPPRGSRRAV